MKPKLSCPNCQYERVISVRQKIFPGIGRNATCPNCKVLLTLPNYTFVLALFFVAIMSYFGRTMTSESLIIVLLLLTLYLLIYVFIIPLTVKKHH